MESLLETMTEEELDEWADEEAARFEETEDGRAVMEAEAEEVRWWM